MMNWTGWLAVALGVVLGGWLIFDGMRAFITGDYVTPKSGEYAGQLGPWAKLVKAVGLDPRSTVIKGTHLTLGALWLAASACLAARLSWAWSLMVACSLATLWYMPIGTLIAVIELALLYLPALRSAGPS